MWRTTIEIHPNAENIIINEYVFCDARRSLSAIGHVACSSQLLARTLGHPSAVCRDDAVDARASVRQISNSGEPDRVMSLGAGE